MIEVRRSHPKERDQLYELWAAVFAEDRSWLDRFFAARYDSNTIYLATVGGKIASALHALPAAYVQQGKTLSCSYIVGAATDPAYRRQGLMATLLAEVAHEGKQPVTLFPAVRPYYEANGYTTTSETLTVALNPTATDPIEQKPIDWQTLDAIYRQANQRSGFLVRDEIAWQFLCDGYQTLLVDNAYAFIKDGKAVEANALDDHSAALLATRLERSGIQSLQCLAEGSLASHLREKEGMPTPMGMSTHTSMAGVYIAEQY